MPPADANCVKLFKGCFARWNDVNICRISWKPSEADKVATEFGIGEQAANGVIHEHLQRNSLLNRRPETDPARLPYQREFFEMLVAFDPQKEPWYVKMVIHQRNSWEDPRIKVVSCHPPTFEKLI